MEGAQIQEREKRGENGFFFLSLTSPALHRSDPFFFFSFTLFFLFFFLKLCITVVIVFECPFWLVTLFFFPFRLVLCTTLSFCEKAGKKKKKAPFFFLPCFGDVGAKAVVQLRTEGYVCFFFSCDQYIYIYIHIYIYIYIYMYTPDQQPHCITDAL